MSSLVDQEGRVVVERCEVARSLGARTKGLLGRESLDPGEGLLIERTNSIHMWFMRFPIDVVFLGEDMTVRKIVPDLKPFRIAFAPGAKSVVELPAGAAARAGIEVGSRLSWRQDDV